MIVGGNESEWLSRSLNSGRSEFSPRINLSIKNAKENNDEVVGEKIATAMDGMKLKSMYVFKKRTHSRVCAVSS